MKPAAMSDSIVIVYVADGADPRRDHVTVGRTRIVAVADAAQASETARELAAGGVGLIELCGGLSPVDRAQVAAAVGDRARVSSVTYGIESLDAAARFKEAFERGEHPKEAFILLDPTAPADGDAFVVTPELHPTTIVPVTNEAAGARSASLLAAKGVHLIELYGGFSTEGIAAVIEAVAGRAAVGAGSFGIDAIGSMA